MTASFEIFFLFIATSPLSLSSDFCRSKDGDIDCDKQTNREVLSKLSEANSLSALVEQDEERSRVLLEALEGRLEDTLQVEADGLVRDKFHQVTALTMQTHCTVGKRVGGRWMSHCGFFRGDSFVCLDGLYESEDSGEDCLVYSFGVAKTEWGLERALGKAGCKVRLFDPLLAKRPEDIASLDHQKFGLADQSGSKEVVVPGGQGQKKSGSNRKDASVKKERVSVLTLADAIDKMGDAGKDIAYLRVDVHGEELDALQQMLSSGALDNVRQLGVSMYTGPKYLSRDKSASTFFRLVRSFQEMFTKLGFRLVHYAPDGCLGKAEDPRRVYYTNFDVVWYKPNPKKP